MISYEDFKTTSNVSDIESAIRYISLEIDKTWSIKQMQRTYNFTGYSVTRTNTDYGEHIIGRDVLGNNDLRFSMYINNDGTLHNPDGPALETWNCSLREKQSFSSVPCFEFVHNIVKHHIYYYINGLLHRTDGPASIENDGEFCSYWVRGRWKSESAFFKKYMYDKWLEIQMKKDYYICGKKYRINAHLPNGNFILEPVKKK